MSSESLSAEEIAEHQLLAALRMWREEDYLCAITLSGAAEEILGKRLRKINKQPAIDSFKKAIEALAELEGESLDHKSKKLSHDLLNQTKNELKHYDGDQVLDFDLKADAEEMIDRAIYNYHSLTNSITSEMIEFFGDVSDS